MVKLNDDNEKFEYFDDLSNKITYHFKESIVDVSYYKFNREDIWLYDKHLSKTGNEINRDKLYHDIEEGFVTPNTVAENLNENYLCIYKINALDMVFISSLFVTVRVSKNSKGIKTHAEYGDGPDIKDNLSLDINGMVTIYKRTQTLLAEEHITNRHNQALEKLQLKIEELIGIKYDPHWR